MMDWIWRKEECSQSVEMVAFTEMGNMKSRF